MSDSDDALTEPENKAWKGETMGAAVTEDMEEADELLAEAGGDEAAAEKDFDSSIDEVEQTRVRPAD